VKVEIEMSVGDYLDRLSILKIKEEKGLDVKEELQYYHHRLITLNDGHDYYLNIIKAINLQLWDLEDAKRKGVERYSKKESDTAFLITQLNDLRHETKKRIDVYFGSDFTEKKSH
tara:strand:- start:172 stop:516 length:345 start_codon:yes stop_codon:yes gene_type:complete